MNYLEAVVEIKNIVDSHFIKRTISLIDKKAVKDLTIRIGLDKNIRNSKEDVNKAYINIQKIIHPDVSPETARLSAIVNEAKEVILKNIS